MITSLFNYHNITKMFIPRSYRTQQFFLRTNHPKATIFSRKQRSNYVNNGSALILGIETSCDDTGCAVVDTNGNVLGEALKSQHLIHLNNGGIIPPIAQNLHRQNIESVVNEAVKSANISFSDITAVAATVKPGLPLSLMIGMKYGKHLCRLHKKPFIPIHHMEAHALTARMHDRTLEFPFLVLLISGGHCLLAVVKDVDDFKLLGESMDDGPGEAFDKMARRLKLKNMREYAEMNGGRAMELAASRATDATQFEFTIPLLSYKNCNFSFSGMKNRLLLHIYKEERKYDVPPDGVIPTVNNLCASFQMVLTRHLCHRVQRAMEYVRRTGLIPNSVDKQQTLVVSGGVACNNFIAKGLQMVCDEMDYKMIRPPPKLCTDNGVMIAWNGAERWQVKTGILEDFEAVNVEKSSPLGQRLIEDVERENISCKWVKLSKLIAKKENEEQIILEAVENN